MLSKVDAVAGFGAVAGDQVGTLENAGFHKWPSRTSTSSVTVAVIYKMWSKSPYIPCKEYRGGLEGLKIVGQ